MDQVGGPQLGIFYIDTKCIIVYNYTEIFDIHVKE